MNLFLLDTNPERAAQAHCDVHCCKLIIESAQLLSTAHREIDGDEGNEDLYKKTHKNHPCAIWVRENDRNYAFGYRYFTNLCKEYTFRYGKTHLTEKKLKHLLRRLPRKIKHADCKTEPPQCMPDEYKVKGNPVKAYRRYYMGGKRDIATWKKARKQPLWFK